MKRTPALVASVLFSLALAACPKGGDRHVDVGDFKGAAADYQATGCADDAREPDDEVAYVLSKSSKDGEKFEALSCPGDDDFIHLFADGRTGAAITWAPSEGELRVDLLDASGESVRLGSTDFTETSNGRVVVQRLNVRGDFYLRIRNRSGTPVRYRVEIGVTAGNATPMP